MVAVATMTGTAPSTSAAEGFLPDVGNSYLHAGPGDAGHDIQYVAVPAATAAHLYCDPAMAVQAHSAFPAGGEVTRLLRLARGGDEEALHRVVPLVYEDLRRVAHRQLSRERPGHTLQATALVHESYMRLVGNLPLDAVDRAHFLAIAARSMRQVLIDHARRLAARKRGSGWQATTLTGPLPVPAMAADELLALDDAMSGLEPRQRQVVECRYFAGMEEPDIALALGVSERTVRRDWVKARAWLYSALYPDEGDTTPPGRSA